MCTITLPGSFVKTLLTLQYLIYTAPPLPERLDAHAAAPPSSRRPSAWASRSASRSDCRPLIFTLCFSATRRQKKHIMTLGCIRGKRTPTFRYWTYGGKISYLYKRSQTGGSGVCVGGGGYLGQIPSRMSEFVENLQILHSVKRYLSNFYWEKIVLKRLEMRG